MRKTLFAAAACATVLWTGCSKSESVTVTIANPLAIERTGEMVEIPVNDIYTQLNLSDTAQFVIYDEKAQVAFSRRAVSCSRSRFRAIWK